MDGTLRLWNVFEPGTFGGVGPRLRDEAEEFVRRLVEGNILEPTSDFVPLGPLTRCQSIGVEREILVQDA